MQSHKLSLDDMIKKTPIEQGRVIFNEDPFNYVLSGTLERSWPDPTPQRQLFFELGPVSNYKEYDIIIQRSLFKAADDMKNRCYGAISAVKGMESSRVMLDFMRDVLGKKKAVKKEDVDLSDLKCLALKSAAEYYSYIAASAMPELKIMKVNFRQAESEKTRPIRMLAGSIMAHNLLYQTGLLTNDSFLREIVEAAECMPSYIAEMHNVSVSDIKNGYAATQVLSVEGDKLSTVPLSEILLRYWE